MSHRSASVAVAGLLLSALLTGCGVSMPETGPVVQTTTAVSTRDDGSVNINPRRPGKGDTPEQIVRGFLDAMTATPAIKTSVAREFLTQDARADWQPTGMIVYGTVSTPRGTHLVETKLIGADLTDERGAWLGPLTDDESTLDFPMEQEHGQWRISVPPDRLIVPQSWFEQRFRQVSLYFFDPSGRILVPEPVFVPRGQQFASTLVNGLLQGPSFELSASELTFLPSDLRPVVSVPVSAGGVADVDLTSDSADAMPAPPEADLLVSQLAWTLRQDPSIERFRVTIGDRPVQLPDGETEFSVRHGDKYAPYVAAAASLVYGVQDGRMVGGTPQLLEPVPGPFGQQDFDLRTVAPDLTANQAAGVSANGTTLWLGSVAKSDEISSALVTDGQDLLDPAWDFSGRLWEIDRGRDGAVVEYLRDDRMLPIDVPGISGEDVKDFLVSRDGTRLIAVVHTDAERDVILVSRILTTGNGRVVSALPAHDITAPDDLDGQIRDIAWRSPTSIAVLHQVSRRLFLVRSDSVDGAPSGLDSLSVTIDDKVLGLVGTPVPNKPIFAFAKDGLVDLAGSRADRIELVPGVMDLGYVG